MVLMDTVEVWARRHRKTVDDFFADFILDNRLSRDTLVGFIFMEFGDLDTVDSNSDMFKKRVEYFFRIHEFNIKKLVDTMEWEYDPLANVNLKNDRMAHYDQLDDEDTTNNRDLTTDITENFGETETEGRDLKDDTTDNISTTRDTTRQQGETEDQTQKEVEDTTTGSIKVTDYGEDSTETTDTDQTSKDVKKSTETTGTTETANSDKSTTDVSKKVLDGKEVEDYNINRSGTDIHFVSAFNQIPGSINPDDIVNGGDVEKSRDTSRSNEDGDKTTKTDNEENGTASGTENVNSSKNVDTTVGLSDTVDGTKNVDESKTGHKESTTTEDFDEDVHRQNDKTMHDTKNLNETENVVEKVDEVESEVVREDIDRKRDYDKTNKLVDKEGKVGTRTNDMDRDEEEHEHKHGNDGRYKFQELIEDERRLAEFNIYKWIIRHMAKELFVGVY